MIFSNTIYITYDIEPNKKLQRIVGFCRSIAPPSEERALAVKKSASMHIVALQLIRRLDVQGSFPYSMCLARCSRAPAGLHLGLLAGGSQQYCVETLRQTGDPMAAKGNKGSGKGAGPSSGWGNKGGWGSNQQSWGSNQQSWGSNQPSWGKRNDGWDNARQSQAGWWGETRGSAASGSAGPGAAPGPAASEQAEQEEEEQTQETYQHQQWQDGGVDPWDDWAENA